KKQIIDAAEMGAKTVFFESACQEPMQSKAVDEVLDVVAMFDHGELQRICSVIGRRGAKIVGFVVSNIKTIIVEKDQVNKPLHHTFYFMNLSGKRWEIPL
ncbi:MAG: hypothetical protein GY706_05850, partial [Bacteroides sp.]|nr:hypothetical protein [Bacteroides sp.]